MMRLPYPEIGPTFWDEIKTAGLMGQPFSINGRDVLIGDMAEDKQAALASVIAAHDPSAPAPSPVVALDKLELYRRMTDAEYETMLAGVAAQSRRIQGIYNAADTFRSDAPEWTLLVQMAEHLYTPERARELLGL